MINGSKRKAGSIALLALILFTGRAFARNLSWNDVVAETKAKNPALIKAQHSLDQARWTLNRAYSAFLPQLSASASADQSDSDTSGFSKEYSYGLSGSLSLFSGFADVAEARTRSYDLLIAEANYARTLSDTLYSVRKSYFDLLLAQETVQLLQDILKQRNQNYDLVQLKYESGSEDKGSLMRIDADRSQARYDLEKAQRAQSSASLALTQAIGYDDTPAVTVTGNLVPGKYPASIDLRHLIDGTPEHRIAQYNIRKADAAITSAKSSFYPELSLSAGTSRSGAQWGPDSGRWNTGLTLSFPLFTGGKNMYDVKIAVSAKTVSEQSLRATDQQLAVKVNNAYTDFVDAAGNVAVREEYATASEMQSEIITTKYINGLASYQDWYVIENDYISSRKSLLNARYNAVIAEGQYKNILGAGDY